MEDAAAAMGVSRRHAQLWQPNAAMLESVGIGMGSLPRHMVHGSLHGSANVVRPERTSASLQRPFLALALGRYWLSPHSAMDD
jgi:hypothetical protein